MKPIQLGLICIASVLITGIISIIPSSYAATVQVAITQGSGNNQNCVEAGNCFDPDTVRIVVGDTVTWTNQDSVGHTATSGNPTDNQTGNIFDSSLIRAGNTYSFTFQNTGTYPYHFQVHPWMTGQLVVTSSTNQIENPTMVINPQVRLTLQNFMINKPMIVLNPKYLNINEIPLQVIITPRDIVQTNNTATILNYLIQNTVLPTYDTQKNFVPAHLNPSSKLSADYYSILSTPQEWPFAKGSPAALLQLGDIVADFTVPIEGHNITSTAIFDQNGKLKFEPIMYLTVANVTVTGSSDNLVVTDLLGFPVVKASLNTSIVSTDRCSIEQGSVDSNFTYAAAPLWTLSYDKPIPQKSITPSNVLCYSDQSRKIECAATYTNVNYQDFWPNIDWQNGLSISQSNVQMANGQKQLFATTCASPIGQADNPFIPEFPLTSTLPLLMAFSVVIAIFQIRNRIIKI